MKSWGLKKDAVHLVAAHDGHGQIGPGRLRLHQHARRRAIPEARVHGPVPGPDRTALLERPAADALAGLEEDPARQVGIEVEAAAEDEPVPLPVVHVDAAGLAARQLDGLRHDEVEDAVAVQAGRDLARDVVELRRLLLARPGLRVQPALLEGDRQVLA